MDLAAGHRLSRPVLTGPPAARHLSPWTGAGLARTGHPERGLEVANDPGLRLAAGVVAVSSGTRGDLGDAPRPAPEPGAHAAAPFSPDTGLQTEELGLDTATGPTSGRSFVGGGAGQGLGSCGEVGRPA